MHEAREKLHDLLAGDLPDRDQVMEQIEAIGELRTKAKKQKIGTMIDVREMLTAEQRAELAQIRSEKRENSGELCREAGDGQRCKHDRREYH